jgi:segregation and condensation protein B
MINSQIGSTSTTQSLVAQVEAILYLKGQPLSVAEIIEYLGCSRDAVEDALLTLISDYAHRDSALEVIETPAGYSLQLRSTFQEWMQTLVPAELGTGTLRTLAAIALKAPILQTELIELRGSSAYQHVQELVVQGMVRKRRQAEGRSYWLEVTSKFHQYFEVDELSQIIQQSVRSESD